MGDVSWPASRDEAMRAYEALVSASETSARWSAMEPIFLRAEKIAEDFRDIMIAANASLREHVTTIHKMHAAALELGLTPPRREAISIDQLRRVLGRRLHTKLAGTYASLGRPLSEFMREERP